MRQWQVVALAEACTKIQDGAHRSPQTLYSQPGPGRFPYLTSQNIRTGYLKLDTLQYCDAVFHNAIYPRCNPETGDVLLTKDGANTGNVAINTLAEPFSLLSSVCLLKADPTKLLSRFLHYYLQSNEGFDQITGQMTGAAIKRIILKTIKSSRMPLPSLPEQKRIVAILDQTFDAITTAKANAGKNLKNARELFQSHLNEVFTKRGKDWLETTVDRISTNLDSQRIPITKSDRKSGEFPYYGASGIVDYVEDYIFEGDTLMVSEDGANLLARSTPIAFSVSGRYWVNNHAHILKFANMATQRFVEFYLESIRLDEYITGAAQPKLTQKALNSIPVPIPRSVEAQARIVARIEALSTSTTQLESIYQRKLAALEALKKSLLHQAFTGAL